MTFLTIDIGSSSTRALLFDDHAHLIEGAATSRKYSFDNTPDGGSTVDADSLKTRVEDCIDEILEHPAARDIRAVGMATFVGNVLGVGSGGQAVTPIYTYADTRSSEDAEALYQTVDRDRSLQRTGCPPHTAYHPARLAWLRRTEPETFASASKWIDFAAYLYAAWFGEALCSYSVASWSGLLNRETLAWDAEWLERLGLEASHFPRLADFTDAQQGLQAAYAARWPQLQATPFYLAFGDGAVANVGIGATSSQCLAITVGTTAAVRILHESPDKPPTVPQGLWGYRLDNTHHLLGGATSEGGNTFQWLRSLFPTLDFEREEEIVQQRPADAHGLTCLPLFNGERSPGWNSTAAGTLHGLRLSTTPTDIFQAVLEGVALRLALIAAQLPTLPDNITIGGGAAVESPLWVQMICNALNHPVQLVQASESTAQGVAVMLNAAVNGIPITDYRPAIDRTFEPQPENARRMQAARERQQAIYQRLYAERP
ncbi:MAG: gluconokinase [Chloroflexi bacterium]|nr:gluconokinase [Chloroflexota bacterium]MCC6894870.1 gluconokinase [Anaerolineae bacterium]